MTMPYWAERLRVRMIHELGGYTDEDVDAEIYRATRATPPCKSETLCGGFDTIWNPDTDESICKSCGFSTGKGRR